MTLAVEAQSAEREADIALLTRLEAAAPSGLLARRLINLPGDYMIGGGYVVALSDYERLVDLAAHRLAVQVLTTAHGPNGMAEHELFRITDAGRLRLRVLRSESREAA